MPTRMSGSFWQSVGVEDAGKVGGRSPAGCAVKCDFAARRVIRGRALGSTLDRAGITGGAHQRSLVPIRRDQNQCFRRAVLLDAPASHGSALPAGVLPMIGNPARQANLRKRLIRRKGLRTLMRAAIICLAIALSSTRSSTAQTTHVVKFHADTAAREYRFEPPVVVAHPHDVLVFQVVNGAPHNITFESADLSPQAHDALNAALPRRSADLTSPLLTASGTEYRVVVPSIPAGRYRFFCLPHRAYDERGELRVE
jgi:plastocyanin